MSSLYRDRKSPFWFLRFKTRTGFWRSKSLRPLRHGVPEDTRKARAISAEHSVEELSHSPQRDSWQTWVPEYLRRRYARNSGSYARIACIWKRLWEYMESRNIIAPQDLTYRHCCDYMPFRCQGIDITGKRRGQRVAAHNTALMELHILSMLCAEAVRRGIISRNPAAKLGIHSMPVRQKPELTDQMIAAIRQALKSEPDWMSHAFEIALHQGCRLQETALFRSDVDLAGNRLHFRRTKGSKPFTVPIHPGLKNKLQELLAATTKEHIRIIYLPTNASRHFHRFFQQFGVPGLCFHSTRVSFVSRLARAGYPLMKAMRAVNHGSKIVHKIYVRLETADVADCFDHLRLPL